MIPFLVLPERTNPVFPLCWPRLSVFRRAALLGFEWRGLCLSVVLLLSACSSRPLVFESPYAEPVSVSPVATVAELTRVLGERHPPLDTFQVQCEVLITPKGKSRQYFNANLLVAFPDHARLRGSRNPVGTLFEIISRGELLDVYFNRDGLLFSGRRSDLAPDAGLLRMAGPEELLRGLLAERDLAARLNSQAQWRVRSRPDHWILWHHQGDTAWQIWVVRKADGLVEETLVGTRSGIPEARVRYWRYELVNGEPFPTRLDIHLAEPAVVVTVTVDKYRLNPELKPIVFQPPRISPEKIYPLHQLRLTDPEGN
jgi:hypothetical protein